MTVATFDPAAPDIRVTEAARAHLRRQMARAGASALRLSVSESGCSGYMYELDYVDTVRSDDVASEVASDLTLHVSQEAIALLRGTEIDCVKEGLNSVLRFRNPNAAAACGCGESFSVAKTR